MKDLAHPQTKLAADTPRQIHLRLLETTDIHGNLLPFDYYTNQPVRDYGLARVASQLKQARSECQNCLLFENGDYLQGTPLSDLAAKSPTNSDSVNPIILAMNSLGYDAAGLGNHEFNYGLDWLEQTLSKAKFPLTCANLVYTENDDHKDPFFAPFLILNRTLRDTTGESLPISIGVLGLAPPQTTQWDRYHLQGRLESRDIIETAEFYVPEMRRAGADLIIALAHTGIDAGPAKPMMENAALQLGDVSGIDAILAGHTHEVFPSDLFNSIEGVDVLKGTVNATPCVMAGSRGSHLGIIDLELTRSVNGHWSVADAKSEARPLDTSARVDDSLIQLLQPAHSATLKMASQPLGHTAEPFHTYLSFVKPCRATGIVIEAQAQEARKQLQGSEDQHLPILSASAPFKTGGRGGPAYYTEVRVGSLRLRHAADLYPFPNVLCAIRLNGAEVKDWLERSAIVFNQIQPGAPQQDLRNPDVPGHQFDMIAGIQCEIDLRQPPRFNLVGELIDPSAHRIRNLQYKGAPILQDQHFILATNNYRIAGSGPFEPVSSHRIAYLGTKLIRDILADYVSDRKDEVQPFFEGKDHWCFCDGIGAEVVYDTGPGLRRYPNEIAASGLRDLGDTDTGFARMALKL